METKKIESFINGNPVKDLEVIMLDFNCTSSDNDGPHQIFMYRFAMEIVRLLNKVLKILPYEDRLIILNFIAISKEHKAAIQFNKREPVDGN